MSPTAALRRCVVSAALAAGILAGCASAPTEYREPPPLAAQPRTALNLATYDYAWSLVNQGFFDPGFRGMNWDALGLKYRPEARAAADDTALYQVLAKLCRELKESHLEVFSPRTTHELDTDHRAGVGFEMSPVEAQLTVTHVQPGSPAAKAGIAPGWLLISRNGRPFAEDRAFVNRLGRAVTYGFTDAENQPRTLTLMPALLRFSERIARVLPGGIRYLRFDHFDQDSLSWLSQDLKQHRVAPGVIIDLRHNGGGEELACEMMIQEFFDHRVPIGEFVRRDGQVKKPRSVPFFPAKYAGRVAVLIGPRSASGSEIFAHVLQHQRRAILVGRRSAGAVTESRMYPLPGGGRMQVPVSDYLGLDRQRIEGRGVSPDVAMPEPKLADIRGQNDVELTAAVNALARGREELKDPAAGAHVTQLDGGFGALVP